MDEGFGMTQIQALKHWGVQNNEEVFLNALETIPFGGQLEIFDNFLGTYVKTDVKQFLVQNTKRLLENKRLILPKSEDNKTKLIGQMRDYAIERLTETGKPKYKKGYVHTLE